MDFISYLIKLQCASQKEKKIYKQVMIDRRKMISELPNIKTESGGTSDIIEKIIAFSDA